MGAHQGSQMGLHPGITWGTFTKQDAQAPPSLLSPVAASETYSQLSLKATGMNEHGGVLCL